MEALTIPGVEAGIWQIRNHVDRAAAELADRHYSREKKSHQVGGPGFKVVLVTPCERAVWISKRHTPDTTAPRVVADGFLDAFRCAMFRNEGAGLSSGLILEAMRMTETLWGVAPVWVTYVDRVAVSSANPGYCFKRAGWITDRSFDHPRLMRLTCGSIEAAR